ncbi:MAG: ribonuclease P protein component [Rhodospirillales bacterium]|nr:ribonuclease P protein component [Rhodospirillales bacterium]
MSPLVTVERLKRRADFLSVAAARRKYVTPGFVLQAHRREQISSAGPARVGFTATRKIGNAVIRNRARRRLKAAADEVMPGAAAAGFDYVVIARAGTIARPYAALVADMQTAVSALAPKANVAK